MNQSDMWIDLHEKNSPLTCEAKLTIDDKWLSIPTLNLKS